MQVGKRAGRSRSAAVDKKSTGPTRSPTDPTPAQRMTFTCTILDRFSHFMTVKKFDGQALHLDNFLRGLDSAFQTVQQTFACELDRVHRLSLLISQLEEPAKGLIQDLWFREGSTTFEQAVACLRREYLMPHTDHGVICRFWGPHNLKEARTTPGPERLRILREWRQQMMCQHVPVRLGQEEQEYYQMLLVLTKEELVTWTRDLDTLSSSDASTTALREVEYVLPSGWQGRFEVYPTREAIFTLRNARLLRFINSLFPTGISYPSLNVSLSTAAHGS
jgi:hypothetical protein